MSTKFNLSDIESISEVPACRGAEVLAILIESDPIPGEPSEKYLARLQKFCSNLIWRKVTGDLTAEFIEAAVERMFTADEVSSVVNLSALRDLKRRIVNLFLQS